MVAAGRMQPLALSQQEARNLLHLPGLQDNSCSHHLPALLGMDNKTHREFRDFFLSLARACL